MSIINEALKKAGREKRALTSAQEPLAVKTGVSVGGFSVEIERKKTKMNWGPIFVLLVLFLITGPIIAPIFSSPFKGGGLFGNRAAVETASALKTDPEAQLASLPASANSENRKAQFGMEEASVFQAMAQQSRMIQTPYLKLSGIVYSSNASYCIINDKIVKIGEDVQGAKLTQVTPKEAILDYAGEKVILSVSQ